MTIVCLVRIQNANCGPKYGSLASDKRESFNNISPLIFHFLYLTHSNPTERRKLLFQGMCCDFILFIYLSDCARS